jgi:uncharacterized protein (DUF2344 family)
LSDALIALADEMLDLIYKTTLKIESHLDRSNSLNSSLIKEEKKWDVESFKNDFNLSLNKDQYKYLTCPNECEDTCWQNIIYRGNEQLLNQWKRQQ